MVLYRKTVDQTGLMMLPCQCLSVMREATKYKSNVIVIKAIMSWYRFHSAMYSNFESTASKLHREKLKSEVCDPSSN